MFTGGKPGTITVKDPKIDTVKRTLSVIEGHVHGIWEINII